MNKKQKIRDCIVRLGLAPQMRGTAYLEQAAYAWRPGMLMKELYPQLGRRFGVSWTSIERGIRIALEYAWDNDRGNTSMIVGVFGLWALHERPKVAEAIAGIGWWTEVEEDQD